MNLMTGLSLRYCTFRGIKSNKMEQLMEKKEKLTMEVLLESKSYKEFMWEGKIMDL